MFETSMVQAPAKAAPRRAGLLSISIIAHTVVILGAAAVSVASVDFPRTAPDEVSIPFIESLPAIPPPLGNPNGGAPQRPAATPPQQRQQAPAPPTQLTAPPDIPDEVPTLETTGASTEPSNGLFTGTGPGTEPGNFGDPNGDPNSPLLDLPVVTNTGTPVEEKVYVVGGEVKAPVLVRRVDPGYPEVMRRNRVAAKVVVQCIIDKNGNVRDPRVIAGAMPPFNDAVMRAITQWQYQPGSYRGQAVETYLTVTVDFGVR